MKVAVLLTAYNNFKHLNRLITVLSDDRISVFLHVDRKSSFPEDLYRNKKIVSIKRIPVWWGGWSHQQAIINLLVEAAKYNFDYYLLLSGSDYPIRSFDYLFKVLNEGGEFINILKGFQAHKPEARIKYYYFDFFDRRNSSSLRTKLFSLVERKLKKVCHKTSYPFNEIYHGTTWWALSNQCIRFVLDHLKENPNFISFFKTSWCPEESLFHTIIGNSQFFDHCRGNLTFQDWSSSNPSIINKNHLDILSNQLQHQSVYGTYTPVFARKFNDNSQDIIKIIDRKLRL